MITRSNFRDYIIGQDDDNDYSESGYLACVDGDFAGISRYSHCSCYDTGSSICSGETVNWDWTGTPSELLDMATRIADPAVPERLANKDDYDYDHLAEMYRQVRLHFLEIHFGNMI